jgi:hypothetical protein
MEDGMAGWTAILSALATFAGLIRDFFSWKRSADDRQAGADAAVIEGRKQEDAALRRAKDAMDEADKKPIEYRD